MATFIRKFRHRAVLSSLLQQNKRSNFFSVYNNSNAAKAAFITYRFSSSSNIKYKPYAAEIDRSDSEDIHPHFSDTTDNNNKTPMSTGNTDGTSLSEFSTDNNKGAKSEELTESINDISNDITDGGQDWSRSYYGLSVQPFSKDINDILLAPVDPNDIECKPDGLIYLPEIKYCRILNKAFGIGGWGLAPRGDNSISPRTISREYALICHERFVSIARGECEYFDPSNLGAAADGAKGNALMRCCKDLGIVSELWDPIYVREFKRVYCEYVFVEHAITKKKRKYWKRKDMPVDYPFIIIN